MTEKIRDLYTCRNCQWGDQCPEKHGEICEYYDSLSDIEAEAEERLIIQLKYIEYEAEWSEFCLELEDAIV